MHAECRTFGHAWDHIPNTWRPSQGALITLRCTRCGCVREDIVSKTTGDLWGRTYHYPAGYQGEKPKTRSEWRLEIIKPKRQTRRLKAV